MADLRNIKGVEIFETGTWNGDRYTHKDLELMVEAFKETKDKIKPHVKLGHNEDQFLLRNDGLPAAGWIEHVFIKGSKLMADIGGIPDKIFELLRKGAYKKISAEIFWDIEIGGKVHKRMISAIAFLGADTPAVTSLSDILAQYGIKDYDSIKSYINENNEYTIKQYEFNQEPSKMEKTEREIELETLLKASQDENTTLTGQLDENKTSITDLETKNETLATENTSVVAEVVKFKSEKEDAQLDTKIAEIKNISPSMRPFVKALLGETKKEYTLDKKEYAKIDLVTEILKLHESNVSVNLDDNSEKNNGNVNDEKELMKKYAKNNNLDMDKDFEKIYRNYKKK